MFSFDQHKKTVVHTPQGLHIYYDCECCGKKNIEIWSETTNGCHVCGKIFCRNCGWQSGFSGYIGCDTPGTCYGCIREKYKNGQLSPDDKKDWEKMEVILAAKRRPKSK